MSEAGVACNIAGTGWAKHITQWDTCQFVDARCDGSAAAGNARSGWAERGKGRRGGGQDALERWTNIPHSCLTDVTYLSIRLELPPAAALFVRVTCWPLYDRNLRQAVKTPLSCSENGEH